MWPITKIIYVGETHDRFSHHVMELEIIKDLHSRGKKIAIGMEMFQRPFQKVVDDYIEGRIDERAFLKGTEYFKRWGFDYNLYRPILLFARAEKIPVVALNQTQEMVIRFSVADSIPCQKRRRSLCHPRWTSLMRRTRERLTKVFRRASKVIQDGQLRFLLSGPDPVGRDHVRINRSVLENSIRMIRWSFLRAADILLTVPVFRREQRGETGTITPSS